MWREIQQIPNMKSLFYTEKTSCRWLFSPDVFYPIRPTSFFSFNLNKIYSFYPENTCKWFREIN